MDAVATMAPIPILDETGILLAEVNMFLKKSRERAAAAAPPPMAVQEIRSWEICDTPALHEAHKARAPRQLPEPEDAPEEAVITQRQLRALKRKHLLIMIRDLEQELRQVKREKTELLLAYQAGCGPDTQA